MSFGLRNKANIKIFYDVDKKIISKIEGITSNTIPIEISEEFAFNMPTHILVNHTPFFPTKYEMINSGVIVYNSTKVPSFQIRVEDRNFLNYRVKAKRYTITYKELLSLKGIKRKRKPLQNQIMRESARQHADKLLNKGVLAIQSDCPIEWHWCHLIGFSLLPTEKAQTKSNLICGTSACNGHMINVETAIKRFIYENKRPLGIEVTAEHYYNTHLAIRIRYRIYDKKGSRYTHSEYFDALTDVFTDVSDYEPIYDRMNKEFMI